MNLLYFLFIILAVVILLVMIVIHELGHYVAGKILKFKINEFSVGFGPLLLSKTNKKTGEKFSLRLIPLGGYCAFEDESGLEAESAKKEEEEKPVSVFPETEAPTDLTSETKEESSAATAEVQPRPRSFTEEKPWKRIIVLAAGALFNFVSAIIFAFIFILAVGYTAPQVAVVYTNDENVPYCSELSVGDVITAVDGTRIGIMKSYDDLVKDKEVGKQYTFTVLRDGTESDVVVTMKRIVNTENNLDYVGLGFTPQNVAVDCGFLYALKYCVPYTIKLSFLILASLGGLITGSIPLTSVTGPVGTVGFMAELGMMDLRNFLVLLPLIAANLAIFNILPVPALDGSKIVFTVIEWIRGKPLNRNVENIIHTVGFLLLFGFVIIIDILGLFT